MGLFWYNLLIMIRVEALESSSRVNDPTSPQEKSFENTLAFVTDERVSSLPIDTKVQTPPRSKWTTQSQWERDWAIAGEYLGTDKTLEKIGRESEIGREHVSQIVKKCVNQLYQIQNAEVKSEFSLDQFSYNKPLPVSSRRRRSEAQGGLSVRIEQALSEGKTIPQIKEELKPKQIGNARKALSGWGIKIPYEYNHILPRFEKLRDPKLPDEEKQKLLDSIEHDGVLRALSSGEGSFIIPVSRIGWQAGLFFRVDKVNIICTLLRSKGVPTSYFSHFVRSRVGDKEEIKRTYYFICATDRDRAIEIIKGAKELDQFRVNPVTIFGKATDRILRIGELQDSGNYLHLGSLVIEIRGRSLGHIKAENIILDDCPASVFRYKRSRFYRLDQKEQLREYLKKRFRELRLM